MQFSRDLKLPSSAVRRLVVEWFSVSKDGTGVTGKGGSSAWAKQAAAQASLSTEGFPISALVRPADYYRLPAALLGQCSWADLGVRMESAIVLGADREMADKYIANVREAILKEMKAAYQKIEIVEGFSYSKRFLLQVCGSRRSGEEAVGSNRRARVE